MEIRARCGVGSMNADQPSSLDFVFLERNMPAALNDSYTSDWKAWE
jgi:hypothetical protein